MLTITAQYVYSEVLSFGSNRIHKLFVQSVRTLQIEKKGASRRQVHSFVEESGIYLGIRGIQVS